MEAERKNAELSSVHRAITHSVDDVKAHIEQLHSSSALREHKLQQRRWDLAQKEAQYLAANSVHRHISPSRANQDKIVERLCVKNLTARPQGTNAHQQARVREGDHRWNDAPELPLHIEVGGSDELHLCAGVDQTSCSSRSQPATGPASQSGSKSSCPHYNEPCMSLVHSS